MRASIGIVASIPSRAASADLRSAPANRPRPIARCEGLDGGHQRVHHRLVARLGLAALLDPGDAGLDRLRPPAEVELGLAGGRRSHAHEQRPVQRACGTAHLRDESHPDRLQQRADVVAVDLREFLGGGAHPAVHVGAVVAVPDRRVEPDEFHAMLGDRRRVVLDPGSHVGGGDAHQPRCSAGVSTGASHTRVSSSSSLSSVIEQPAISSEVM